MDFFTECGPSRVIAACFAVVLSALVAQGQQRMVGMGPDKDSIPYAVVESCGLPVVEIETIDHEWPTAEYVSAPSGYSGKSIINATKVPGRMVIRENGQVRYDSGDYIEGAKGMTVRIRGNTSAYADKKPYKIHLEDKSDLLQRNNPNYREKDWLLLRDEYLAAMQGFEVNRLLEMMWTPGYKYVNLVMNGEYLGMYMLVEQVKRNPSCRIPIAKDGFLVEYDSYWWVEDYYVRSKLGTGRHYSFKYPDEWTTDDKTYISTFLKNYEASVLEGGDYAQYLDVESLAKWCLGEDLVGTSDAGGVNLYFVLNDRTAGARLTVPMMWDFDSSENNRDRWSRPHSVLLKTFFRNDNRDFVDAYITAWERYNYNIDLKMMAFFQNFYDSPQGVGYMNSMELENQRWNTFLEAAIIISDRGVWFLNRKEWLDKNIAKLNPRGDVSIDGIIDIDDVNILINMLVRKSRPNLRVGDLSGDGSIDVDDLNILLNILVHKE